MSDWDDLTTGFASPLPITCLGLNKRMIDRVLPEFGWDGDAAITGRATMIDALIQCLFTEAHPGEYSPESSLSAIRLGSVGRYRGAAIMVDRNYRVSGLPGNELWITKGDKTVRILDASRVA